MIKTAIVKSRKKFKAMLFYSWGEKFSQPFDTNEQAEAFIKEKLSNEANRKKVA